MSNGGYQKNNGNQLFGDWSERYMSHVMATCLLYVSFRGSTNPDYLITHKDKQMI